MMPTFGGQSMWGRLNRVILCNPSTAGWSNPSRAARWSELGYWHTLDATTAENQHHQLRQHLQDADVEILDLPRSTGLSLDAVYAHDASFITDRGAVLMRMGKSARTTEPAHHATLYEALKIPIVGAIIEPGTLEAGDIVWLDSETLLVGRSYRTNQTGINQLRSLLAPSGIEVIEAPLPHGQGPAACLHLMSLVSVLDAHDILVDRAWLAVQTVDLLTEKGFNLIEIDPDERDSLACNVVALGNRRLIALEENPKTIERMQKVGFEVKTIAGTELCQNGSGGPTCLTRPVLRS